MSSRTDAVAPGGSRRARRAALRARLSRPFAFVFALLILILAGIFVYQAGMFVGPGEPIEDASKTVAPPDEITVKDSTVTGFDREKQPYAMTAKSAVQDRDKPNLIKLETIQGETRRANGDLITIAARNGLYNSDTRVFDLDGDVMIDMQGRFTARMDKAQVVVADKMLKSHVPVAVSMGDSTIDSNALEISNDGKRILFFNGVKAKFKPSGSKGDNPP